jgi:hypothetical protein
VRCGQGASLFFQLSNYMRWRTPLLFSTNKIYDGDIMWWSDTTFSIFADLRPCSRCQAGVACLLHRSCRSGKGRFERGSNYCEAAEGERSHRIQGGKYSSTLTHVIVRLVELVMMGCSLHQSRAFNFLCHRTCMIHIPLVLRSSSTCG